MTYGKWKNRYEKSAQKRCMQKTHSWPAVMLRAPRLMQDIKPLLYSLVHVFSHLIVHSTNIY